MYAHIPKENNAKNDKKLFSSFQSITFISYSRFSTKQQTFFAKKLSFLIKAGVPMLESIQVLKEQTRSSSEKKVLDKVINDVSNGQALSKSMEKFKGVFGNFAINVIKAGETSGTLIQNLNYLAEELKKKEILRKKIMGALLYPLIVTVATIGITVFLVLYIFPKIIPIFSSMKIDLPLSTRILIFLTDIMRDHGTLVVATMFVLLATIVLSIKYIKAVRYVYDGMILKLPLIGGIIKNYNLANTTRTLGLLLKSGVSLNEALIITADTTDNLRYKKFFNSASGVVLKGKGVSGYLKEYKNLFPPILGHMVLIGEKSGNLSNTFAYLSEYHEHEFEDQTKNLSSAIEPALMIVMGLMVGFVAVSVITPIYAITSNLQK